MDIFPSLCDVLGFEIPESVNGQSFAKALKEDVVIRDRLYFAYTDKIRGITKDSLNIPSIDSKE